ncbi:DUF6266 family protein [Pedobacter africanus]|uniref:Uncharacterized protein n=1 Tax=Pedobacter africanus TaxID=151894 RepID=A0A1W1Z9N6_9SPHI|nr:DUF6266 family protein [Pedobacter africanus]SMC44921.1 hypothetical protein SAMN04488524_0491 [Pedobacter africanus]
MARFNGLFDGFNGKLGNLVSYNLKGKQVIRKIGRTTKAPSTAQLAVRQKLLAINTFLKPILPFINVGFELEAAGTDKNPHNIATAYNVKHALQGEYPNISIDYSRVMVSMGALPSALTPAASVTGTLLTFTWGVAADMDWSIKNDRAMLLIYCPELGKAVYSFSGTRRSTGTDGLELPPAYLGKALHCYIAFKSSNGKKVSDSVWINGAFN